MKDKIETDEVFDRLYGVPVLGGLLAGLLSFVAGYLSFLGIAAGTGSGIDFTARSFRLVGQLFYNAMNIPTREHTVTIKENRPDGGGEVITQEDVVNILYNPITTPEEVQTRTQIFLENETTRVVARDRSGTVPISQFPQFNEITLSFPPLVYLAIPVLLLGGAGFVFAYKFIDLETANTGDDILYRGLLSAGSITLGFGLLVLAGMYLFTIDGIAVFTLQEGEGVFTRPDRMQTIQWGIIYPLVCGLVGSTLGMAARKPSLYEEEEDTDDENEDTTDETATDDTDDGRD